MNDPHTTASASRGREVSLLDARSLQRRPLRAGCVGCPLKTKPEAPFGRPSPADEALIESLKHGEADWPAGEQLIHEGDTDTDLFTLLAGWAARFKTLPDGRRQIVNVLLPGDFIGLQQRMDDGASHGVLALTALRLCRFERGTIWTLHRQAPNLGYDITWLAAHEQRLLDDQLVTVGRRSALERVAALMLTLYRRASPFQPDHEIDGLFVPLTQQQLADTLGLSLIQTHRSLRQLSKDGLLRFNGHRRLRLLDAPALAQVACMAWPPEPSTRPLI